MHLDDIQKVLRHCYNRQAESGARAAFRFRIFIGAKKKRLDAVYAETSDIQGTESEQNSGDRRKDKGKKKCQEDPLDGLLRIDQRDPAPTRLPAYQDPGPSNHNSTQDVVRVGMGEMLQLKAMGYSASGPVNGPNEGLPEYEVPKDWLQHLLQSQSAPIPNSSDPQPHFIAPNQTGLDLQHPIRNEPQIDPALVKESDLLPNTQRPTPRPRLIPPPTALPNEPPVSLPVTGNQHAQSQITAETNPIGVVVQEPMVMTPNRTAEPDPPVGDHRPNTPPNDDAEPAHKSQKTPKKQLGKRAQATLSPQMSTQTRTMHKRKKMTNDDLAALEAQKMLQTRPRQRKVTKRH